MGLFPQPGSADEAWSAALRLLAMRARTAQDVRERLARRGFPADEIERVIARLAASRYLDDAAFARSWLRSRAHRAFGPARIARELRTKGVPEAEVTAVLGEAAEAQDVRSAARTAATRKLHALRGLAPDVVRRRLAAYLFRQGFTTEVVLDVLKTMAPE